MHWHLHLRRHTLAVVAPLAVAVALAFAGGATALAPVASAHPAHSAAPAAPARANTFIYRKLVLPQTSIDGPALSSVVGTFEGQPYNKSVIAWTGTDSAHHLNVMTSKDGLHFDNKRILNQTSPFRPDVTQQSGPAGGNITVAWTGTDPNHSLNVLFDVYGTRPLKLTLWNDNSFTAPAILQRGAGSLLLVWAGTDPNHSLNMLPITIGSSSLVPGHKTILSQFSSNAAPHLASRVGNPVVLTWSSRTQQLGIATSTDGVHFSATMQSQWSAFAPSVVFPPDAPPQPVWLSWAGTGADTAHHLNLQWSTSFPRFLPALNTVLGDTAFGGPALAFNTHLQIAWTGTDPAHHLNIAYFLLQ